MTDGGDIRTCFLTARLPRWAGVRHNVLGSNISGLPVPSPETYSTRRSNIGATMLTLRNIAATQTVDDQLATLTAQNLQMEVELNNAIRRIAALEQSLTNYENNLEQVMQRVNMV